MSDKAKEAIEDRKIYELIKEIRDKRIALISKSDNEASKNRGKVIMHIIPVDPTKDIELKSVEQEFNKLKMLNIYISSADYNLDGFRCDFNDGSYLQLFRNGEIVFRKFLGDDKFSGLDLERILISLLDFYIKLESLSLNPPIFVTIDLLHSNGLRMLKTGSGFSGRDGSEIKADKLPVDLIKVENFDAKAEDILRPAFDAIWQAIGWPGSPYYDENGNRREATKS